MCYLAAQNVEYKNIRISSTISGYLALQIKNLSYGFAVTVGAAYSGRRIEWTAAFSGQNPKSRFICQFY